MDKGLTYEEWVGCLNTPFPEQELIRPEEFNKLRNTEMPDIDTSEFHEKLNSFQPNKDMYDRAHKAGENFRREIEPFIKKKISEEGLKSGRRKNRGFGDD